MRDLKTLREGWNEVAGEERRSAEQLTIEQSGSIYVSLCRDMAPAKLLLKKIIANGAEAGLRDYRQWRNGRATKRSDQRSTDEPLGLRLDIETFNRIEEILEDYGLAGLIEEHCDEEAFDCEPALAYYQSLEKAE